MGVPAGVEEVVVGDFLVELAALLGFHHFYEFCGTASPELVRTDFGFG